MNEGIIRYTSRFFPIPVGQRKQVAGKQDYKAKLWSTPVGASGTANVDDAHASPYADAVRHVVGNVENGVAFQSLAVAALQTLEKVLACEKKAANAAISLAHGEKLTEMIETTAATAEAIAEALDAQGTRMLDLSNDAAGGSDEDRSWWFALTEAIESIEDGTTRILSLASGQPKDGPGRKLSSIVVRLLRRQHQQLLAEADAWIS